MQAKKYQIFVSSTYTDLIEERREAIEAILDLDHIPAGMEGFPAIDMEQFKYIQRVIDQCDYYILLVGARYGSVANDGKSFTEKEYRYAVERGKVVIALAMHTDLIAALPPEKLENEASSIPKLDAFRAEVMDGRMGFIWSRPNDIFRGVTKALRAAFDEFPRDGWVRASTASNEDVLAQINDLRIRNEALVAENAGLSKSFVPDYDNIAGLDEAYDFKFEYLRFPNRQQATTRVSIFWRSIFKAIGPKFRTPTGPLMIQIAVANLVDEIEIPNVLKTKQSIKISEATGEQIRAQLVALGLLEEIRGTATDGTPGEWLRLSNRGERVLTESLIVRSTAS